MRLVRDLFRELAREPGVEDKIARGILTAGWP